MLTLQEEAHLEKLGQWSALTWCPLVSGSGDVPVHHYCRNSAGGGRGSYSQEPNLPNGPMAGPLLPSPRLHGYVFMCDVLPEGRGWPWVQPCDFSHHWAGREQGGSPPVGLS